MDSEEDRLFMENRTARIIPERKIRTSWCATNKATTKVFRLAVVPHKTISTLFSKSWLGTYKVSIFRSLSSFFKIFFSANSFWHTQFFRSLRNFLFCVNKVLTSASASQQVVCTHTLQSYSFAIIACNLKWKDNRKLWAEFSSHLQVSQKRNIRPTLLLRQSYRPIIWDLANFPLTRNTWCNQCVWQVLRISTHRNMPVNQRDLFQVSTRAKWIM